MDDLPQQFLIENYPVNVELLDNRTGEITADAIDKIILYLVNIP